MSEQRTITGTTVSFRGDAPTSLRVQAFDRDLPSLERRSGSAPRRLGEEAVTDAEGRFQITYTSDSFTGQEGSSQSLRPRDPNADLSFRVFDRTGRELTIRKIEALDREFRGGEIIFNAPTRLEVTLFVASPEVTGSSEVEQQLASIAPVIDELPVAELSDDDIAFLVNELDLGQQPEVQQHLIWLRECAQLTRETNLPTEAFYGWARTGLPDQWAEFQGLQNAADRRAEIRGRLLEQLAATPQQKLIAHLQRAVENRIIPERFRERAGTIAHAIRRPVLREVGLRLRLESEATGEALAGYSVSTLDIDANNRDLGSDVTDPRGEFAVACHVDSAENAGERSLLFRVRGPGISEVVDVTERFPTDNVEIGIVHLPLAETQPTLKRLREDGRIAVSEAILQTLEEAHSVRSFSDIRRLGGLSRVKTLRDLDATVMRRLDALADLDRLSGNLDETVKLLDQYDSVVAIATAPRGEFIASMTAGGVNFSPKRAAELHVNAKAQTDLLNQIFAGFVIDSANRIRPSSDFSTGDYYPPLQEEQTHD